MHAVKITEQQYSTFLHANGQFCKIDTSSCIATLYVKNDPEIGAQCSLSIFHTPHVFPPIVIMSRLWIFISTPTTQGSGITMIYPDKATSLSLFQQLLHILKLPPACSAKSRSFNLPLHYVDHMVTMHVSFDKASLNTIIIHPRPLYLATL